MNYENTHLINSNTFSKKYTNKINDDNYEYKYHNLKNNKLLSKWANNNIKENVNSIKNLDLTNVNMVFLNHNNDTNDVNNTNDINNTNDTNNLDVMDNTDNTNDTDDTDDIDDVDDVDDTKNNKTNIIKANMEYFNNLHINRWKYNKYKETVNSICKIKFKIKEDNNTIYQKIEY